jgi:TFIIF-interacting CTD phosphatase-like protein
MKHQIKNRLVILDLDHTLIYSTNARQNNLDQLLRFGSNLFIYERPHARELIALCKKNADIIVFTTAVEDYAKEVCEKLEINFKELHSRKDCQISDGFYEKRIEENWLRGYSEIIVIDDSPEVWDSFSRKSCQILVPEKFKGDSFDENLKSVIDSLREIISG